MRVLAALLLALSITAGAASAQQAYPMRCRGGGAMTVSFKSLPAVTSVILDSSKCRVRFGAPIECEKTPMSGLAQSSMDVTFFDAGVAANSANPGSGQCAWLDRPVGRSGQLTMMFALRPKEGIGYQTPIFVSGADGAFRFNGLIPGGIPVGSSNDPTLLQVKTVLAAMQTGGLFTVYAHAMPHRDDMLVVTAVSLADAGPQ